MKLMLSIQGDLSKMIEIEAEGEMAVLKNVGENPINIGHASYRTYYYRLSIQ